MGAEEEQIVGRDSACDVRLAGTGVSRRHAALRWSAEARRLSIVDLGSRNGVRVAGHLIQSAELAPGDVLRLGGSVGVVTAYPSPFAQLASGVWGGGRLQQALEPLEKAAASDLPIVLQGETGTGKELAAHALHAWSGRAGPLVAVNCAALPESLAEAELFGYRRGAFTGADRSSPGLLRSAHGGTLLLDEVSDLSLPLQAKLLRALEQREVQPLGEVRQVAIDVRVVVAGQQSLASAVSEGRFRADLLARLEGVTVCLPPLRERREDVPLLFSHLLGSLSEGNAPAIESDFVEHLCLHDWPFNVRELVLLVRRLLVLHGGESTLHAGHLPQRMQRPASASPGSVAAGGAASATAGASATAPAAKRDAAASPALPEPVQLPALLAALRTSRGNVARAAAMLGITRQRVYRIMDGHAIDVDLIRDETERRQ